MKIKLGVIFDQKISVGGGFTQIFETSKFLNNNSNKFFEPIFFTNFKENIKFFEEENINVKLLRFNIFQKVIMKISINVQSNYIQKIFNKIFGMNSFEKSLLNNNIDLVYFLSPSSWSLYLNKLNYIITIWDLCHRNHPEFPEIRNDKIFEEREKFLTKSLPKATSIITDSIITKSNLIKYYNLNESNIEIIEFKNQFKSTTKAINFEKIINKFKIKNKYIFYPAQFWSHKNHIFIIDGIKLLKSIYKIHIDVVFTGNDKGNLDVVKKFTKKNNLENHIHFLGFVNSNELSALYKKALALVMPSYFGPTNIPPLEAFHHETPVIYSNFENLNEEFKKCICPIDPNDPISLAEQINLIINNPDLSYEKISYGIKFLKNRENKEKDDLQVYNRIFKRFSNKLKTWKGN